MRPHQITRLIFPAIYFVRGMRFNNVTSLVDHHVFLFSANRAANTFDAHVGQVSTQEAVRIGENFD